MRKNKITDFLSQILNRAKPEQTGAETRTSGQAASKPTAEQQKVIDEARRLDPNLTEEDLSAILQRLEAMQANRTGVQQNNRAGYTAAVQEKTPTGRSGNSASGSGGKGLIEQAQDFYKKHKLLSIGFLVAFLVATAGLLAYPYATYVLGKKAVNGGLGNLLGGTRNAAINTAFLAGSLIKKAIKFTAIGLIGVSVGKGLYDYDQGRDGFWNSMMNGFGSTKDVVLEKGGKIAGAALPRAESAYNAIENAAVSGAGAVGACVDNSKACQDEAEKTADSAAGFAGGALKGIWNLYTSGYALTVDTYYGTILPGTGKFLYDQTLGRVFSGSTKPEAAEQETPKAQSGLNKSESRKINTLISGDKPANTAPSTEKASAQKLSDLGHTVIGSRYVSVCTPLVVDRNGDYLPGMREKIQSGAFNDYFARVDAAVQSAKESPSSAFYRAVTGNNVNHVVLTVPVIGSGTVEPVVSTQSYDTFTLPKPTEHNGQKFDYTCKIYGMGQFLKGGGISYHKIPGKPIQVI